MFWNAFLSINAPGRPWPTGRPPDARTPRTPLDSRTPPDARTPWTSPLLNKPWAGLSCHPSETYKRRRARPLGSFTLWRSTETDLSCLRIEETEEAEEASEKREGWRRSSLVTSGAGCEVGCQSTGVKKSSIWRLNRKVSTEKKRRYYLIVSVQKWPIWWRDTVTVTLTDASTFDLRRHWVVTGRVL